MEDWRWGEYSPLHRFLLVTSLSRLPHLAIAVDTKKQQRVHLGGGGGVTNISSHTREKKQTNNPCTCVLRAVPRQHFLLPDSTLHARRDPRWRGQMGSKEVVCLPVYIKPYASTSLLCVRPAICCITGKTLPSVFCSSPHPTTPGPTLHRLLRPLYHRLPKLLLDDRCCQHGGLVTCIFPHSRLARCQRML